MTAHESLAVNPLFSEVRLRRIEKLLSKYPILGTGNSAGCYSLWKYIEGAPERFYSEKAYQLFLEFLIDIDKTNREILSNYLDDHILSINNSYRYLKEVCSANWHDKELRQGDDYQLLTIIDREIHPSYLTLVEGVFKPLLRIVAHFSRLSRGKPTDGLEIFNVVEELRMTKLGELTTPYDNLVRNSIAHGGVTYSKNAIVYTDKKGHRTELDDRAAIRVFDDLLDICSGLSLSLSVFLLSRDDGRYSLPMNLLIDELVAATRAPYWEVVGCLPSTRVDGTQLIVYAQANSFDTLKIRLSIFQTAILAEKLAPEYDWYFVSIKTSKGMPGFSSFSGEKLAYRRECNSELEEYGDVLDQEMLFFAPKIPFSRFLGKFATLWYAYKANITIFMPEVQRRLGLAKIGVRNCEMHRNSWGVVLNADVVVDSDEKMDQELFRRNSGRIVKIALKSAKANKSMFNYVRYLPLGFCRISVCQKDYRARRLSNFGLANDLVCIIQVQRIKRIRSPDILGATIEILGRYRIAWNRNWLNTQK